MGFSCVRVCVFSTFQINDKITGFPGCCVGSIAPVFKWASLLQGHLHGQKMREANHRAAMQIFERVNASLLPRNVLDLHGLHVDEALQHLQQVLLDKTTGMIARGWSRLSLSPFSTKSTL